MIHDRPTAASQTPHPCGQCQFYEGSVWTPIEPGSVSVLAGRFHRRELEADQVLFEQGDANQGVFCVSRGLIALRTHHADGTSTLLKLAYPGEVIGFRSFLDNGNHKTEARALIPSRVCTVARRDAERVVRASPGVLARLAARCVDEIDRNQARIIATATTSNKERLADTLMELIERHGEVDGEVIRARLPLSRKDLADLIGVPPETLSRLIGRLGKEGFFAFSGREVRIPAEGVRTA
ncbi:Crp/Fnr family transcriptional regulator [Maritimibacter fusiformis]|uniref:Crp/Fnr family transcriptional regulator n=1 Tax=Maritimibacter fusiformis TaxID=2603819 RepID=A0A5D0RQS2_9RHOB|nr:Crp/Fnr family transcriptional regulator [Maritimibacter fusiformis]TYB83245.1 Crp/Fnr family transcriptional regulator [Maritimibacter fusiformis]